MSASGLPPAIFFSPVGDCLSTGFLFSGDSLRIAMAMIQDLLVFSRPPLAGRTDGPSALRLRDLDRARDIAIT